MAKIDTAHLLIDGDILAYRASAATDGRQYQIRYEDVDGNIQRAYRKYKKEADLAAVELGGSIELHYDPEPESHAYHLLKQNMLSLETDLIYGGHAKTIVGQETFLTNKGSFREKEVDPTYKMNRKDMRRPAHLAGCKQYLTNRHGAVCEAGVYEADDLLAIRSTELQALGGPEPIICSIDKDLKQVPGWHWDFVKKKLVYINERQGHLNFYAQLLIGDPTDGIVGLKGIGPKTADKILKGLVTERDMYVAVLKTWLDRQERIEGESDELYYARILWTVRKTARLLYLLRERGGHWEAPA